MELTHNRWEDIGLEDLNPLLQRQFVALLEAQGVVPFKTVGETFNPELHEAVDTAVTDAEMDGRVIEEYSRGFRVGDRLLRPARVKVGRAAKESAESA